MNKAKAKLPDILEATEEFERWAGRHVNLIRSDVKLKHHLMADAPFPFFRATFYRWAQWWPLALSRTGTRAASSCRRRFAYRKFWDLA